MIGWWPGDGDTSDLVGGNAGGWTGAATYDASGKVGAVFQFHGSQSQSGHEPYVSVGNPTALDLTGSQVTIDGWIRPTANDDDRVYFGKTQYGNNNYVLLFQFGQLTGMLNETIAAGSAVPYVPAVGQWTHIAMTYDGSAVRLYANGVEIGSVPKVGSLPGGGEFAIGGRATDPFGRDFRFNGSVDEVQVFSRALSGSEISAIYAAGTAGTCRPVVVTMPSTKDDCKSNNWKTLTDDLGRPFKNQGDCVSFVATKGRNKAAG